MAALRPYQAHAVNAVMAWVKKSVSPCVVEAATGAGKSHMIAEIARQINATTSKRVLCLAPSAELVTQNREKYLATGNKAGLFSASAGGRDLRYPVVFGSPLTVKNRITAFQQSGNAGYAMVICDEAHGITPTIKDIIKAMRDGNPNLRVVGFTATPYRLGDGYVFRVWPDGKVNPDTKTRKPYYTKLVYQIGARELIDQGFLTPPVLGEIGTEGYDTHGLELNSRGQFDSAQIDRAYHGHGRKTAAIIQEVVAKARDRRGVMIFAATVQHAKEVMASLPPELTRLVTAETPQQERAAIISAFKSMRVKYIVNVSVLTTGFDAPHVDLIAILRKTESVGLLQQIIGRGLRIHPGKTDCLVLDYTTNMEDHCPDGDLFAPEIKAKGVKEETGGVEAECPQCSYVNNFTWHKNAEGLDIDRQGYCIDADGQRIETDYGPMPAHHGRRCWGMVQQGPLGEYVRCNYRWTFKACPHCEAENDIAARYCHECKGEIIDPNEKLKIEFKALKRDPTKRQTDRVVSMKMTDGISQKGNRTVRVDFVTPYRQFAVWFTPNHNSDRAHFEWSNFQAAIKDGDPQTVSYVKDISSGFYRVLGYNHQADLEPAS